MAQHEQTATANDTFQTDVTSKYQSLQGLQPTAPLSAPVSAYYNNEISSSPAFCPAFAVCCCAPRLCHQHPPLLSLWCTPRLYNVLLSNVLVAPAPATIIFMVHTTMTKLHLVLYKGWVCWSPITRCFKLIHQPSPITKPTTKWIDILERK
eukprot:1150840-Pelagomonas_calceolata.AAC.3